MVIVPLTGLVDAHKAGRDALEERIRQAERTMADALNREIFYTPGGNYYADGETRSPITTPPWTVRCGYRWYAFREWIAVHILRVQVGEGDEW